LVAFYVQQYDDRPLRSVYAAIEEGAKLHVTAEGASKSSETHYCARKC
jgi:hypothetical protein